MACAFVLVTAVAGCSNQEPQPDQEFGGTAEIACAAMHVSTPQQTLRAGDDVQVTIDNVEVECLDQGETSATATPMTLEVLFVQGENSTVLASFNEADGPTVTVDATIPADALPGDATIEVEFADPAPVTVEP
jgi:hypothetical protein